MPYIKKINRARLLPHVAPTTPGELNFVITTLAREYLKRRGTSYKTINEIVGAMECAKLEFARRVVAGYEDSKIETNGDVY
jgi:hypothetical protein